MRRDYTLHCLRASLGGFTPLTFAQFVALRGSIWSPALARAKHLDAIQRKYGLPTGASAEIVGRELAR